MYDPGFDFGPGKRKLVDKWENFIMVSISNVRLKFPNKNFKKGKVKKVTLV